MREDADSSWIDISIPFSSAIQVWPGDVPFSCGWTARREEGSSVNLGVIHTSTHAGTHADAPFHVETAWSASESLPIDAFVGECRVVSVPVDSSVRGSIEVGTLRDVLRGDVPQRLLLRTGVSVDDGRFPDAWPVLSEANARWLVEHGLRLLGVDAPSVDDCNSKTLPVHHVLFNNGAFVLENLSLKNVTDGDYELVAQPLAIVGADAAPVRALLRRTS